MQLYLHLQSPNCVKVLFGAALLGLSLERKSVERWMCWTLAELIPVVRPFQWECLFKPRLTGVPPDPAILEGAVKPFQRVLRILDDALAARRHVAAEELTLADVTVAGSLMYADAARMPLGSFTNICRWFDRVRALPEWSAAQPTMGAA